jgi:hypothetical protein
VISREKLELGKIPDVIVPGNPEKRRAPRRTREEATPENGLPFFSNPLPSRIKLLLGE